MVFISAWKSLNKVFAAICHKKFEEKNLRKTFFFIFVMKNIDPNLDPY